jgi:hypothetical protein
MRGPHRNGMEMGPSKVGARRGGSGEAGAGARHPCGIVVGVMTPLGLRSHFWRVCRVATSPLRRTRLHWLWSWCMQCEFEALLADEYRRRTE